MQPNTSEIEGYLRSKGRTRRRGNKLEMEFCPFCLGGDHKDKWKFVVYGDAGNFKCVRGKCQETGNFWRLIEHYGDDPRPLHIQDNFRPSSPSPQRKKEFTFTTKEVEPSKLTDEAMHYLKRRGFSEAALEELSIWCDDKGLINFGYYHKGELCMVKVRQPRKPEPGEQKAWQAWRGGLRTLWGLEQCVPALNILVITFGEYDRIALYQARVPNTVSVPCGDNDLEWINTCWDHLEGIDEFILWLDNDESGQNALAKIADRLGRERIRVVRTPFKDANEMLVLRSREVGIEAAEAELLEAVNNAEWVTSGDLVQLADVTESEQCFDGYTSAISELDKHLGGFFFKQLIVHTGSSKHGKSAAVNQIAAQAAAQGGVVCFWPGEDNIDDFKYKLYVHIAGAEGVAVKQSQRTGTQYAVLRDGLRPVIDRFVRDRFIILDKRSEMNEDVLLSNFLLAKRRYGCDTFIVDNLMKIVAGKDTDNINFRQARICNLLSDFAKENRVTVHLVTHTNKMGADTEPPTRNSISGAKEILNLADRVISWWRIPKERAHDYGNAETLCTILADRVFGAEREIPIRYYSLVKRYAYTAAELQMRYPIEEGYEG